MFYAKHSLLTLIAFMLSIGCSSTEVKPTRSPNSQADQNQTQNGSQTAPAPAPGASVEVSVNGPTPLAPDQLPDVVRLDKKFFVTYYNKTLRIPAFSEYTLSAEHLKQSFVKRKNRFHADADLTALGIDPVKPQDYRGSGYDRGHMAPSGDFTWAEDANDATFVMSNMSPQKPGLNRQAWSALENKVRQWACAAGELRVITGPILTVGLSKLDSNVAIPQKFYKIIVDQKPPMKAIGFVMSQDDSAHDTYLKAHQPIKNIEAMAGINFVATAADADRARIENDDDLTEWKEADCAPARVHGNGSGATPSSPNDGNGSGANNAGASGVTNPATNTASATCPATAPLKTATISGCCRGHHGVMGPKHLHACCTESNQVICNDGTPDNSCKCDQ